MLKNSVQVATKKARGAVLKKKRKFAGKQTRSPQAGKLRSLKVMAGKENKAGGRENHGLDEGKA